MASNGCLVPLNQRLALMNMSQSDLLVQMLLNELASEEIEDDTLSDINTFLTLCFFYYVIEHLYLSIDATSGVHQT